MEYISEGLRSIKQYMLLENCRHPFGFLSTMRQSGRTSGAFWNTSKTRDNRRFPGTAEKTLHGQGLESVSVEGTVGGEEEDPLLWPGVRPPEVGPG